MRRGYGGMISFEHDGVHHLLMIGGVGSKPAVKIPHYGYLELCNGNWHTNEHSIYNISSKKWSNPSITGQCIQFANGFIIEKICNTRAVLFGGRERDDKAKKTDTNNIYIIEISISTVFWQCIKKPEAIDQWPVGRLDHAGAIIITGSDCPMLVISGGRDKNNDSLDDCWIFNITQHSWIKLGVPHSVSKRWGHSLSVFIMSPHYVWIITVGGTVDKICKLVTNPNIAMLTELVLNSKAEWTVGDTLDTNGMNNEEYKKMKYQQQLQTGRRPRKEDTKAQIFYQQMKPKEREEAEKDQEIKRDCHLLQENSRVEAEKEEKYHINQLQEKDGGLLEKDRELQEKDRELQEKDRELLEKDRELQEKDRELQEKDRELQEKDRELQEKDRELQEKEKEKEEAEKEKRHHQHLLQEKERNEALISLKTQEIQQYRNQLQEKEQEIVSYCNLLQEKEKEKAEMEQRYYWQLQESETKNSLKGEEMQRYHYQLREKEHQLLEEQRLKEKYFQQLQDKDKKLAEKEEKIQMCHQQLQEKEREEAQRKEYYNHVLQKEKELEKEIQRLNQLLQNKDQELIESDKELKEHQQIQQHHEHLKDINIQEKETRVDQDKAQEIKLLHSSEVALHDEQHINEVEQAKELLEEVKIMQKEDNSKGNEIHESNQDQLKGVHVAAKNSFLIHGGSTQSVNWEKYGIKIKIPQGAVQPSDTLQVTIAALVGGDFIFPEDTELVSAVYAINLSKPFLKHVKLEIQHCVSIEKASHCNYLSFATAKNNQPPYQFDAVDGGEFSIGNRYGGISIAKFSKFCIKTYSGRRYQPYSIPGPLSLHARSRTLSSSLSSSFDGPCSTSSPVLLSPFNDELHSSSSSLTFELPNTCSTKNEITTLVADKPPIKCYHSQVMYEIKRQGREWLMRFLLSKDLNALIEYIRKAFRFVEKSIEVSFQFKDDDEFIELCFDKQCPKGWSVRPHQDPTRVRQTVIDKYGSMSPPRFPECLITISATPGEDTVKELSYPVILQGIKESNFEKINIVLTMGDIQQASLGSIASNSELISPVIDDKELKSAGEVLRKNFDTLSEILAAPSNLSAVIMSLYAKELISDTTATECMNTGRPVHDRCASLLFALKATIDGKPQAMITLIEVLKKNEAFKEIADKMDLEVTYHTYTNP